jgi:hypothetical protein
MNTDIKKMLDDYECEVTPCGSRITVNPPPDETDEDYLVLVPDNNQIISGLVSELDDLGFHWEGHEHYQDAAGTFMSWRSKDNVNLIITRDKEFHRRHLAATDICKRLNLKNKSDRIALFQAILYGNIYDEKGT